MKYPKKVMTIKELTRTDDPNPENNIGYSREWLLQVYRLGIEGLAWKTGTGGKTSTIYFDTELLEKYKKKLSKRR